MIGGGLDRTVALADSERVAEWISVQFEPPGRTHPTASCSGRLQQVAETIRGFLEPHRLSGPSPRPEVAGKTEPS